MPLCKNSIKTGYIYIAKHYTNLLILHDITPRDRLTLCVSKETQLAIRPRTTRSEESHAM